jgi:hypothetical protein
MIKLIDLDFLSATPSSMADWSAPRGGAGGTGEATYFDAAGNLQVAAAGQWRDTHDPVTLARLGRLLEPGRTNYYWNSRAEAAVAGTPGTIPFRWSGSFGHGANGLTREIIGNFTVDNIPVVRVRIYGTTTNAGFARLSFSNSLLHVPPVTLGEAVTSSVYVRLVSGNFANFTWRTLTYGADSVGVFVGAAGQIQTNFTPTNAPIRQQRAVATYAVANASVAYVAMGLDYVYASGVTVDFTVDIALPQIEKGTFATSPMLNPVGVTTGATTRAADDSAITISALSAASLYVEERTIAKAASGALGGVQADDGTANNRLAITAIGGTGYAPAITGGGAGIASFSTAAITDGAVDRAAISYAPNAMAAALDGASLGTDTSGTLAANISRVALTAGERVVHLRALRLYTTALTLAQVQALTLDGAEPIAVGIGLPAIRRPAEAAERLVGLTQTHQSPFDGSLQTLEMPGARWELTATWPTLGPDDRRVMAAFLASLRGKAGRFLFSPAQWSPRRASGGGSPVINGDFQTGTTLSTRGWTALGQAMRAGDWLSFVDTRGRRRLHLVLADVSADAGGIAALQISPPIRRAGADGAAVEITAPSGIFMLPQDEAPQLNIRAPSLGQVTITMQEALV